MIKVHEQWNISRILAATIGVGVVVLSIWSVFGKMDMTVTAVGKIEPEHPVVVAQVAQTTQSSSTSNIVKNILIKNGQHVKSGDVLVEFESTSLGFDIVGTQAQQKKLELDLQRIDTLLGLKANADVSQTQEYLAWKLAYDTSRLEAKSALDKAVMQVQEAQADKKRIQEVLKLVKSKERDQKDVAAADLIARSTFNDIVKERVDLENQLVSKDKTVLAAQSAVKQAQATFDKVLTEQNKQLQTQKTEALMQLKKLRADVSKLEHSKDLLVLKAPVDGVVYGLNVNNVGQVVPAGSAVLNIVPEDTGYVANIWVKSEDVGFIGLDQQAKVKVASFPFQKYGWLTGAIESISANSDTIDPNLMATKVNNSAVEVTTGANPLYYKVKVKVDPAEQQSNWNVRKSGKLAGLEVLKPGMQVQTDVVIGKQSLFEYLTSGLKKTAMEALSER